ncbi:hypothetical protein EHM76_05515 [bacterium]|nr:MAG: hypothetical protein EHM76_05515 [bacterium]
MKTLLARFRSLKAEEVVKYLRRRGAAKSVHKLPGIAKLIFCIDNVVRLIKSPCTVSTDGKVAYLLGDALPDLFKKAQACGESI